VGVLAHTGFEIFRLRASAKGQSYSLTVGEPLQRQSRGTEDQSRYVRVCVFICVYICMYVYTCVCVCVCVCVCEGQSYSLTVGDPLQRQSRSTEDQSRYVRVCVFICVYICMYVYTCVCVCVCLCVKGTAIH
jgi:hypothetical protein